MVDRQEIQLLREAIELLLEDDYGDLALSDAAVGPYGQHFGSGEDLYKIFVKPFTDVVATAAGGTKELSQRGQTLLKTAFEAVATSLLPFMKDNYSDIFADEAQQIKKIRQQYAKVYNDTWEAFNNHDLLVAAFMYRPDLFLTTTMAKQAPRAAGKLLSVLSGGRLDKALQKFNILKGAPAKIKWSKAIEGPGVPLEGVIREAGDDDQEQPIVKLVNDERVKKVLANSEIVKKMTQVGKALVQGTLKKVYDEASAVLSAKNLVDLQKKVGKKLPGMDKLQQVPEQERQGAEQALLANAKKALKEFYVKNLQGQVEEAIKAGVPQQHPYVHDYQSVLQKIKAL